MYGVQNDIIYIGSAMVTYQTLSNYHTILTGYYRYVQSRGIKLCLELRKDSKSNKYSFFYGQTYSQSVLNIIDRGLLKLKSKREYNEFYDFDDRDLILQSFLTIRDEVIFRLSLLGCRIDEILSLRIIDYDDQGGHISLYSSKGKETSRVNALIQLDKNTILALNNYIENERTPIVKYNISKNRQLPESLFLNIKAGDSFGKPLLYRNYLTILKRSCSRVGFDSSKIRTHSGRKTRNMDLLHIQQDYPELNLSDLTIQHMMRWKSPESQIPYRNTQDRKTQHFIAKQINKHFEENGKNE
jgi:integrase